MAAERLPGPLSRTSTSGTPAIGMSSGRSSRVMAQYKKSSETCADSPSVW